ncbi:unnamed protein product [Cercospora beticola]|nr:unnamed protein product [Cercospora beticola]
MDEAQGANNGPMDRHDNTRVPKPYLQRLPAEIIAQIATEVHRSVYAEVVWRDPGNEKAGFSLLEKKRLDLLSLRRTCRHIRRSSQDVFDQAFLRIAKVPLSAVEIDRVLSVFGPVRALDKIIAVELIPQATLHEDKQVLHNKLQAFIASTTSIKGLKVYRPFRDLGNCPVVTPEVSGLLQGVTSIPARLTSLYLAYCAFDEEADVNILLGSCAATLNFLRLTTVRLENGTWEETLANLRDYTALYTLELSELQQFHHRETGRLTYFERGRSIAATGELETYGIAGSCASAKGKGAARFVLNRMLGRANSPLYDPNIVERL